MGDPEAHLSSYDSIARLYDPWSVSVREDVDFYVELARVADGPVVELGVGTGRIADPDRGRRRPGHRRRLVARDARGVRGGGRARGRRAPRRPPRRRPEGPSGAGTGRARHLSLPRVPAPAYARRASRRAARSTRAARARRPVRLRRVRPRRRRHRRDPRPLARARTGHLRTCGLGCAGANADALRPRRGRPHDDGARLADPRRVAEADRGVGLRDRGALRLVRPTAVPRRRGLCVARASGLRRSRVAP